MLSGSAIQLLKETKFNNSRLIGGVIYTCRCQARIQGYNKLQLYIGKKPGHQYNWKKIQYPNLVPHPCASLKRARKGEDVLISSSPLTPVLQRVLMKDIKQVSIKLSCCCDFKCLFYGDFSLHFTSIISLS